MIKTFGPGLLFACTAIGVSHLMQSTRAGAEFGFALVVFVILANVLKYPFYEFSSRYTNATGTSMIDGYLRLGRPFLLLYFAVTVVSMFFVTGAVGFVTAGFMENLFSVEFLNEWTLVILFAICASILVIGRYTILDGLLKIIASVLIVSTILALVVALYNGPITPVPDFEPPEIFTGAGIFFLIALMGWMPMPIDTATWHSLWTLERIKQTKFKPHLRETLLDFNIGYLITAVLAVVFLTLGAYIFFGSGEAIPNNNAQFAAMIISLYTETVGDWSGLLISASAFSVMFGTIIAVLDGYSRALSRMTKMIANITRTTKSITFDSSNKRVSDSNLSDSYVEDSKKISTSDLQDTHDHNYNTQDSSHLYVDQYHDDSKGWRYPLYILLLVSGSFVVVTMFADKLKELVDFATIVSFLIAPVIALFNFRLVTGRYLVAYAQPPSWLKALAFVGVGFLAVFAIFFILVRLEIILL